MSSLGEFAVEGAIKAAPYVAKTAFNIARDVSSHFMRDPKLQQKAINCTLKKGRPLIDEAGKAVINKLADAVATEGFRKGEYTRKKLVRELIFIKPLESFLNRKVDGVCQDINTQDLIMIQTTKFDMIQRLEKSYKFTILQLVRLMLLLCSMMSITLFVEKIKTSCRPKNGKSIGCSALE